MLQNIVLIFLSSIFMGFIIARIFSARVLNRLGIVLGILSIILLILFYNLGSEIMLIYISTGIQGLICGQGFIVILSPSLLKSKRYPGDDPTQSPGRNWLWVGTGKPGSQNGYWVNQLKYEVLKPHMDRNESLLLHWEYRTQRGRQYRFLPDGSIIQKPKGVRS